MATTTTRTTIDREEIQAWVDRHGGHAAIVKGSASGRRPGQLLVDFPDRSAKDDLEFISWDEFFNRFEAADLAFVYRESAPAGADPLTCELIPRPEAMKPKRPPRRVKPGGNQQKAA